MFDRSAWHEAIDHQKVQHVWKRHQSGAENNQHVLWAVLMMGDWLRRRVSTDANHRRPHLRGLERAVVAPSCGKPARDHEHHAAPENNQGMAS
jgi:hypothetical protein